MCCSVGLHPSSTNILLQNFLVVSPLNFDLAGANDAMISIDFPEGLLEDCMQAESQQTILRWLKQSPPRILQHGDRWEVELHQKQGVEDQCKILHNLMMHSQD